MSHPWLKKLLDLQKIDLRLRELEARLKAVPSDLEKLAKTHAKFKADRAAAKEAVSKLELECKKCETDITALGEENMRLKQQSVMVKTNDEYNAMITTLNRNSAKISELEEKAIELYDQLEAEKVRCAEVAEECSAGMDKARADAEELVANGKKMKQEFTELKEKRVNFSEGIDPATLSRYQMLAKSKLGGIPVTTADNGICNNCHMKITPQTAMLMARGNLAVCDNCQHYLYDAEVCGIEGK